MAIVSGNAIKYNGEPIDYLIIFDWETGFFTNQIKPSLTGDWSIDLKYNQLAGLLYIADGCAPITHGPYQLIGDYASSGVRSGFLFIIWAYTELGAYNQAYDVTATTAPTWGEYFEPVLDIGSHSYNMGASTSTPPAIINDFQLWWNLEIRQVQSTEGGGATFLMEFLNGDDVVIFTLRGTTGYYAVNLSYKIGDGSFIGVSSSGSYPQLLGNMTFTESKVIYTKGTTGATSNSFEAAVDMTSVVKTKISGTCSHYGGEAGAYVRLLPRVVEA